MEASNREAATTAVDETVWSGKRGADNGSLVERCGPADRAFSSNGHSSQGMDGRNRSITNGHADHIVIDLRDGKLEIELVSLSSTGLLAASPARLAAKRALDLFVSTVALLVLAPVFGLIALAVKVTSRGPVFYISDRVGKDGEIFDFVKFRTMRIDADATKSHLTDFNEVDGPVFKIKDDPRVTRVGRLLRRFSLDELPQLYHVLRGQMSLVGPRPPIPEEVVQYTPHQLQRLAVKPGLTCIWQVSGRSELDFDTWVELDLRYIQTWSLRTDLELLGRTLPAVLSGRGAY